MFTQSNHRERILVVEDDLWFRAFVTAILRGISYEVIPAQNGREAIATFSDLAGKVDLFLVNFRLPDTNGYQLACELMQERPGLKIICMSSLAHVQQGFTELGLEFIDKPFLPDELILKVRQYLAT